MREVLWSDFLNGKFYINCETEKEAKELFDLAENYGVLWNSGSKLSRTTCFSDWREETCYLVDKLGMVYNGIRYARQNRIPVLKYSKIKLVDCYSNKNKNSIIDASEIMENMIMIFGNDNVKSFLSCSAYFYRCLDEQCKNNGYLEFAKCCEKYLSVIEGVKNNE